MPGQRKRMPSVYECDLYHYAGETARQRGTSILQAATDRLAELACYDYVWLLPPYQRAEAGPYGTQDYYQIWSGFAGGGDASALMKAYVDKAHGLGLKVLFDITTVGHGFDQGKYGTDYAAARASLPPADQAITLPTAFPAMPGMLVIDWKGKTQQVIAFFQAAMAHQVQAFGIDGFRCDYVMGPNQVWPAQLGPAPSPGLLMLAWSQLLGGVRRAAGKPLFFLAEAVASPPQWSGLLGGGFDAMHEFGAVDYWNHRLDTPSCAWTQCNALPWALEQPGQVGALTDVLYGAANAQPPGRGHGHGQLFWNRLMFYASSHDSWTPDPRTTPSALFGGDDDEQRVGFLTLLLLAGTLIVFNGQEIGYTGPQNFLDLDQRFDIRWAEGSPALRSFYADLALPFRRALAAVLDGAEASYDDRSSGDTFALVRHGGAGACGLFWGAQAAAALAKAQQDYGLGAPCWSGTLGRLSGAPALLASTLPCPTTSCPPRALLGGALARERRPCLAWLAWLVALVAVAALLALLLQRRA